MFFSKRTGWRLIAALTVVLGLGILIASRTSSVNSTSHTAVSSVPRSNPIIEENSKLGTDSWKSKNFDSYLQNLSDQERLEHAADNRTASDKGGGNYAPLAWVDTQPIKGYANKQSVNIGDTITFHVSSSVPTYNLTVIRQGWYGGNGGRWMAEQDNLVGTDYGIPAPDPTTGMIEANWPVAYSLTIPNDWVSGVYLVWLSTGNSTSYIIFVVRNDAQVANILFQIPLNTYQAYNEWGGKSLYDYNSDGGRAYKVSFNRPYAQNDGSGLWYGGDYDMVRWLEMNGYDVTYATSEDLQTNPNLMNGRQMFLTNFHDEYYSWHMYDNLMAMRDAGKNFAFFSSNNIYWQVRYEPSPITGVADRTLVCYKKQTDDPSTTLDPMLNSSTPQYTTVLFKDPPVNRSESGMLSTQFESAVGYGITFDWVVKNANHWIYQGTGLNENDVITKLVGYEWDRFPGPIGSNVTMLSQSPVQGPPYNWVQEAAITTYPSGATVFTASTNYWAYTLMGNWNWPMDTRVRQMTANIIAHMTNSNVPTATPTSSPTDVVASETPVDVSTSTYTPSATNTDQATNTAQPTSTLTYTPSSTYTSTATRTGTAAPTYTPSRTNTATRTSTAAPSATYTPSRTYTSTTIPTATKTNTLAPSKTNTPTATKTNTPTATKTNTVVPSKTNTPTATKTNTPTATKTNTPTATKTNTPTATKTNTPTATYTPSKTYTPVPTNTPAASGTFYRAINLNGPSITIDGNAWQAQDASNFDDSNISTTICNQSVTLIPSTDANRSQMIRCSLYGSNATLKMTGVPSGQYQVYLYIWEDNSTSSTYTVKLEGQTVTSGTTGSKGTWQKLGPFTTNISDGTINVVGSNVNMSGLEVRQLSVVQPTATAVPQGTFYRGINLNGPYTYVNGQWWEGTSTGDSGVSVTGSWSTFCNQSINLTPDEDYLTENMIRCSVTGQNFTMTLADIPNRKYDVYLWVWEDSSSSTYTISMQSGQAVMPNYKSGVKGNWDRLGPFTVSVSNGKITINVTGGSANISGIELWKR